MNDLETEMHRIIDAVLNACVTTITITGEKSLTKEEILGPSRKENAVMVRTILATALAKDGFSVTTIGQLLGRTERQVRMMVQSNETYKASSNAYRIAISEVKRLLLGHNSDENRK